MVFGDASAILRYRRHLIRLLMLKSQQFHSCGTRGLASMLYKLPVAPESSASQNHPWSPGGPCARVLLSSLLLALLMATVVRGYLLAQWSGLFWATDSCPQAFQQAFATTSPGQVCWIQAQQSLAFRAQSRQESRLWIQRLTPAIPAKTPEILPSTWTVTEATHSTFWVTI